MWTTSDPLHRQGCGSRRKLRAGVAAAALAWALTLGGPASAQEPPSAPEAPKTPSAPAASRQELRAAVEKRYEILPLHNGIVLRPRQERLGVRTVELSGDTIAVNGERVTEGVLRAWLAEDADLILRLRRLGPGERQALFELKRGAGSEEAAAEAEADADEEVPSDTGTEEEVETETGETEIPAVGEGPPVPGVPGAPPTPPTPETSDFPSETSGSRVKFGGGITIAEDELAEEAVAILGSVRVEGEVSKDVAAIGGGVIINGRVGGDVSAVGGDVRLGPKAVVEGDVSSAGGNVIRAEGSRVEGQISEAVIIPADRGRDRRGRDDDASDIWFHPWSPFLTDSMDLFWQVLGVLVLGLLVFLCILVARGPLERVERHVRDEPWLAGLIGFVAQLTFLPLLVMLTILLVITIVGCALIALYPFLFIALGLAALLGYAAVALRLGRFLEARFGRSFGSPYAAALIGVLAIEVWSILGKVIGLGGGGLDFIALTMLAFGVVVQYVAWTVGIGAVLMARFGGHRGGVVPPTMAPVAPMPPSPPYPPAPYPPAPVAPAPAAPVPYDPVLEGPEPER